MADDYPPYPCPLDPDGMHSVGCGCEFVDDPGELELSPTEEVLVEAVRWLRAREDGDWSSRPDDALAGAVRAFLAAGDGS